jgi:hypothetical protein
LPPSTSATNHEQNYQQLSTMKADWNGFH